MSPNNEEKAFLKWYFNNCEQKGHKLYEWGGMTYCAKCGGASYLLSIKKRVNDKKQV